ncbi:MAG: GNAT family N-acetyltransferase [Gemmatimonadaceae bacterium]|nr:GNAT family N-acetyltransferase [Gemmatimonadaceae bacterium]
MTDTNALGQPIGPIVRDWSPPPRPVRVTLDGRYCRLEPLDVERHAAALFAANALDVDGRNWTYLFNGPFETFEPYREWVAQAAAGSDPLFFAIVDVRSGEAVGVASYLRIDPANGVIEVGHINYSPRLQRSPAATEAMYLMARHVFDLGYRRYEWKCNALNAPSRRAAVRYGFSFEGIFRQAVIVKGRNRDTSWYAMLDADWPGIRAAFEQWLAPENFDAAGTQRVALGTLTARYLHHEVIEAVQ